MNLFATDNLTLGANYTYTHAKNKTQDTIVKNVPKHKFFAFVDWKMLPNLSLYVSQEAEHGRYYLDGGNTGNFGDGSEKTCGKIFFHGTCQKQCGQEHR